MRKIIILIGCFSLIACDNDNPSVTDADNAIKESLLQVYESTLSPATNRIFVERNGVHNSLSSVGTITPDFEDVITPFSINEVEFTSADFGDEEFMMVNNDSPKGNSIVQGGIVDVSFNGQTGEAYVPKLIELVNVNPSDDILISKTDGITLNWDSDPNNPFETIFIVMINRGQFFVEDYPDGYISTTAIDSNGSLQIHGSEFNNDFNLDDMVDIYIGRGNEVQIGDTAFTFFNVNLFTAKMTN